MSSEDEDMDCDVQDVFVKENHVLPPLSLVKYNRAYQIFQNWNKSNGWCPVSEDLLLKYFAELAVKSKPSSLFAIFSMLKATFRANDDIDISGYSKLLEYLKEKNLGYKPVKAKVFTEDEIEKFINEAPDDRWLDVKVVCIFGVSGAYSTKKLVNVMVEHVKKYDDLILVTIPRTDTSAQGTFTITGTFFRTVQKYADLRPENVNTNRFFLKYYDERCCGQPIGKNKFSGMPRRMANYLKLSEPERYSALSFRINAANLGNSWNMPSASDEQATERAVELDYQTGHIKKSSFSYARPVVPAAPIPITNKNGDRIGTWNGTKTGTVTGTRTGTRTGTVTGMGNEHVCTLDCAQVKCALSENEKSVLHAFTILKPSEYTITDVTPAVYPSEPACRWIVAYTHNTDAVTAFNADETFEEITRSVPHNVRINQKFIRGNTSQVLAAYVVVYGVNCQCQKEATDVFDFAVNEVKFEV